MPDAEPAGTQRQDPVGERVKCPFVIVLVHKQPCVIKRSRSFDGGWRKEGKDRRGAGEFATPRKGDHTGPIGEESNLFV